MRRSKLEIYEDILSALFNKYLSVESLAIQCNIDCVAVEKRLEFLMENNLVRRSNTNKKELYTLTTRGEAVSKELNITQRLNKLKTSIEVIGENIHEIPVIPEQE
jgi:predicted transcriptional regulator